MRPTRPSSDIPGVQPQVLTKATPVTPIAPETFQSFQTFQTFQSFQSFQTPQSLQTLQRTFQTFQSFMTFQPLQAILQILHCSSISRDSTPFQHSPTRMHILQFLQILQFDWFPQKLHRVPVEQLQTFLQTFYRHYILQRKGDVVISVKTCIGKIRCQDDILFRIELIPSFILSSDNTNYNNVIQLFLQLFDE